MSQESQVGSLKAVHPQQLLDGGVVTWAAALSSVAFAETPTLVAMPGSPLLSGLGLLRMTEALSSTLSKVHVYFSLMCLEVGKAGRVVPQSSRTYPVLSRPQHEASTSWSKMAASPPAITPLF